MTDSTYRYAVDLCITGDFDNQQKVAAFLGGALAGTGIKTHPRLFDAKHAHLIETSKDAMESLQELYHHLKNNYGRPDREMMERARDVIRDATTLQDG